VATDQCGGDDDCHGYPLAVACGTGIPHSKNGQWCDRTGDWHMKLQDFRIGARILLADPVYSIVAVVGLGVGLAVCLLLLGFARYSYSYDAQVPDADSVYIVKERNNFQAGATWRDQAPLLLREAARLAPGVTNATGYLNWLPLTLQVHGELRQVQSLT